MSKILLELWNHQVFYPGYLLLIHKPFLDILEWENIG
jgi:hypothetical protein